MPGEVSRCSQLFLNYLKWKWMKIQPVGLDLLPEPIHAGFHSGEV